MILMGISAITLHMRRFNLKVTGIAALLCAFSSIAFAAAVDVAISTPSYPADTVYVNVQPNFSWAGPSTTTVAALGANSWYALQVSSGDINFGAGNIVISVSTPAVVSDTNSFTSDALYISSFTLTGGATYYWRVKTVDGVSSVSSPWSRTYSFNIDLGLPAASAYKVVSAAGSPLDESQYITLLNGVTVQITAQDALTGLAVSTAALWGGADGHDWGDRTGGFSVKYTTNAGAGWVEGAGWTTVNSLTTILGSGGEVPSMAVYGGKLYAGSDATAKVAVFDGTVWSVANGGGSILPGSSQVAAMAVYNGRLYAGGDNTGRVAVFDGSSWGDANGGNSVIAGETTVISLAVYNGKLYAGTAPGGKVAVFDGTSWSASNGGNPVIPLATQVRSMAVYNGKLYAGTYPDLKMAMFDGVTWSPSNNGNSLIAGEAMPYSMAVYNGKLYVGTYPRAKVAVFNGSSWSPANNNASVISGDSVWSMAVYNGKLYAGGQPGGAVAVFDGETWSAANGGRAISNGQVRIGTLAVYNGKLYAGTSYQGKLVEMSPSGGVLSGADGTRASQTLEAYGLNLAQSTNAVTCGGASPCGATNQVVFNVSDLAGNVKTYGPYAVLEDYLWNSPLLVSTPSYPANGAYVAVPKPGFTWLGVSTTVASALGTGSVYSLEVDNNLDFSSPEAQLSTPVTILSTSVPTSDGYLALSAPLADNTTYYWRVRVRTAIGNYGPVVSTYSFLTDFTRGAVQNFRSLDAAGNSADEAAPISLASGVTAQIYITDAGSGLALSTSSLNMGGGISVFYSTSAGNSWITGSWAYMNGGAAIPEFAGQVPLSAAVYRDKLYVGLSGGLVVSYNGSSWVTENNGAAPLLNLNAIYGMKVYKDRLYILNYVGYIGYFDGISWTSLGLKTTYGRRFGPVYNSRLTVAGPGLYFGDGENSWVNISTSVFPAPDWYTTELINGKVYLGIDGSAPNGTDAYTFNGSTIAVWQPPWGGANYIRGLVPDYDGRALIGGQQYLYSYNTAENTYQNFGNTAAGGGYTLPYRSTVLYNLNNNVGANPVFNFLDLTTVKLSTVMPAQSLPVTVQYQGRIYSILNGSINALDKGKVLEYTPAARADFTGADGVKAATVTAYGLNLAQSVSAAACGGAWSCAATNQVVFVVSDQAGNVTRAGPYAVLVDYLWQSPLAVTTPTWPANGAYINSKRPNFTWIGVSTNTAATLGTQAQYIVDYSVNPDFSGAVALSTPVVLSSTNVFTADGSVAPASDLVDNTTYYWRVRLKTISGNYASVWSTYSFVSDFTPPMPSDFKVKSSTGGWLSEDQWINLKDGATLQINVQDLESGLAVSTSSLWSGMDGHDWGDLTSGFSVKYTTTSGTNWVEGADWAVSNNNAAVVSGATYVLSLAVYNGKLYAGTNSSAQVGVFDGNNNTWSPANGGNAVATGASQVDSLAVYNGKLYAGTYPSVRVGVFDGTTWTTANGGNAVVAGENRVYSMAVYNGKLYAGTYPNGKVCVFDGTTWTTANGGSPVVTGAIAVKSLAVYNGKLYAGTAPNGIVGVFDGTTWTTANGGSPVVTGATYVMSLAVYSGKLYAGTIPNSKVGIFDGTTWSDSGSLWVPVGASQVNSLAVYNGKLYAGTIPAGKVGVFDGTTWSSANNKTAVAAGATEVNSLAVYNGKLYAGTNIGGYVSVLSPSTASLTGMDGSVEAQVLLSSGLPLAQSQSSVVCNGSAGCSATNQVVFNASDLAGNVKTYGPYAVLVDTTLPLASAAAFSVSSRTLTLSASGSDALSGLKDYHFEVSPDPGFSSGVSSTAYTASNSAVFADMLEATVYYGRVKTRDNASNESDYSATVSTTTRGFVSVSSQSLAPAAAMQGTESVMLSIDMVTNPGKSTSLTSLVVTKGTSAASSSDIAAVKIYRDNNMDGLIDGGDSVIGSAGFSGINAAVTVSPAMPVTDTVTKVLVVYSFSSAATVGRTAKAEITSAAGLIFTDPYVAAPSGSFPLSSGFTAVTDGANTLTITPTSVAPSIVPPGTGNIGIVKLAMQTNMGTSLINKLNVRLSGTVLSNNIPTVKLYRDNNGNALFDLVGDTLLTSGSDIFTEFSSTMTLAGSAANRTVGTTPVYFFVVVDVAADAPEGGNFSVIIATASSFTLANPADTPVMTPISFQSNSVTIQTNNSANINIYSLAPAQVTQGGKYAMALASCSVSIGIAEINRVKVNRTGGSIDSDVKAVWIYKDDNDGGYNPNFDAVLGSAAFSGGVATVNITTMTLTGGATSRMFVVYEISPTATGGNTLGAGFTNSTYFRIGSPFTSVYGNFPFNTAAAPIQVTINPLLVENYFDVTTGQLFQGTTNNALLKLVVRSELNPVSWTALRVKKTGTLADSYVDAVKVFRDADGDEVMGAGDELVTVGNDIFVAGDANLSFSSPQSVTSAGGIYFVTMDLHPDSPHGSTLGVEVSTTGWLAVNSPNYISTASAVAPYIGGPTLVKQYPNIVTVSTSGILPGSGVFPGSTDIPVMKLTLKTDISKADLLAVKFSKTGTLTDAEVKTVKIYYDSNGLGTFNPNNLAAYALVTKSTVSYGTDGQPGIVQLNLDGNKQITKTGENYFVVIDLSTSAVIGRSMVMRALDNSYFTVSAPNSVAALSFNSQTVTVMAPPQTLSVAFENKLSTYVIQGQQSVLVASFTVSGSSYTISVSQIKAARSGTGFDSDASAIKLYKDNGNGSWGGIAEETLLSAITFSGGVAAFSHAVQSIDSPNRYTYYIVADISETAVYGRTFGVDFPAVGYFTVDDPHSVGSVNFPYTGQKAVIQATVDTMIVDPVNAAPSLKQADTAKVMGRLRLRTDTRSASFVSLKVDKAGDTPDADIYRVRLYKDDGNQSFDFGDELVGTLNSLASGSGVLTVSPSQTITTIQRDYFVAVDIATYAVVGSSFVLTLTPEVLSPDAVSITGSTAVFTMAGTIQDNPDTVYLDFASLASQSLYLGASDVQMAKLSFRVDQDSALMTMLKFNFTGTAGPSDIAGVKLYRDTDGSGYFDTAYDVVAATAMLVAGEAYLYLPNSGEVITTSTKTYFVVLDISGSATIGNSVSLGMPSAANVTLAGIDIMNDFSAKATVTGTIRDPRIPTPPVVNLYKADNRLYSDIAETFNAYRTLLKFKWTSSASQGSVEQAYYYIGAVPADENTPGASWVAAGAAAAVTIRGLNLLNSGSYYISVKVKNSLGAYYSDIVSKRFVVDTVVPVLPEGSLYVTDEGGDKLVNWTSASVGVSGVEYYVVEERRGNSPLWVAISTTSDRFIPISNSGARPSEINRGAGSYFYRVYAVNNAGVSGTPSETLSVNLGLEQLTTISDASFYPNPFDSRKQGGTVAFTLNKNSDVTITIYDAFGWKVKSLGLAGVIGPNSVAWDGKGPSGKVSMGMYLCVIKAAGDSKVLRVGVKH